MALLYKTRPSDGALALRAECSKLRIAKRGVIPPFASKYGMLINWGSSDGGNNAIWASPKALNKPTAVAKAVNKITALNILKENNVNVPEFWTDKRQVQRKAGTLILARAKVAGSSGEGITIVRDDIALPDAPLYVKYIRKEKEYRLHVFKGRCIFIQQKKAKEGFNRTADQSLIRSHGNGFVFAENEVEFPNENVKTQTIDQATKAVAALGLDFGAVDVILSKKDNVPYVLEVNTAPGLESTALKQAYSGAILNELGRAAAR